MVGGCTWHSVPSKKKNTTFLAVEPPPSKQGLLGPEKRVRGVVVTCLWTLRCAFGIHGLEGGFLDWVKYFNGRLPSETTEFSWARMNPDNIATP